jgi:DNA-binding NarL/FixJ family response regulator
MTRIFILARIGLYREALGRMLSRTGTVEVVGTHGVDGAAESIQALRPGVVLLDMAAPEAHTVARALHETQPDVAVIGLGVPNSEAERLRCAEVGIVASVSEDATISELLSVIDRAARGEAVCSPTMARDLVRKLAALTRERQFEPQQPLLTRREREIAGLLADDLSNKEIATRLGIEVATVKNHVHSVLEKLSVRRRSEITRAVGFRSLSVPSSALFEPAQARVVRK